MDAVPISLHPDFEDRDACDKVIACLSVYVRITVLTQMLKQCLEGPNIVPIALQK